MTHPTGESAGAEGSRDAESAGAGSAGAESAGGGSADARLDVFGDLLPDTTSDERAGGADWREAEHADRDEWLRGEVPPHH